MSDEKQVEQKTEKWFSSRGKAILFEIQRMWFIILLSILLILPDDNRWIVAFALGCVTLTTIVAHLTRKTIWPYIDLRQLVKKASSTAIGASIIVAAVVYLMAITIQSVLIFLKP
jgi:hypothetical protein